ncbi:MAG: hypothetical protein ACREEW_09535 [Caulobacteraceae bacterium]
MRKLLLIAGAAALLVPGLASAQTACRSQQHGAMFECAQYAHSGYYDSNGVWHATRGYYDRFGNWVEGVPPSADVYGANSAYVGPREDVMARANWLDRRIDAGESSAALSNYQANLDRNRLASIRDFEGRLRNDHGGLTINDRARIGSRLNNLSATVNAQWNGGY